MDVLEATILRALAHEAYWAATRAYNLRDEAHYIALGRALFRGAKQANRNSTDVELDEEV